MTPVCTQYMTSLVIRSWGSPVIQNSDLFKVHNVKRNNSVLCRCNEVNLFSFGAGTGIILNLVTELETGQYRLVLKVADNQGMAQDNTIRAEVCGCTGKDWHCPSLMDDRAAAGLPLILGVLGGVLLLLSESAVSF